jgi:predicted glutamine amidotransferase
MCRVFGFKSVLKSQVHSSLIHAENALADQSDRHPNGWGVSFYHDGIPHIIKSPSKAIDDKIFHQVSGVVTSQVVLAHIRNATQGDHSIVNCHPFQYGRWTFAHNGNIKNFDKHKNKLLDKIPDHIKRYVLGQTDSELIFALILSHIEKNIEREPSFNLQSMMDAVKMALQDIQRIIGTLTDHDHAVPTENYLTFILTDGDNMIAHQGGQPLYLCTYKTLCPERDICPHFSLACEAPPSSDNKVNHLIFSSEKIEGPNVWEKLKPGSLIGINNKMVVHRDQSKLRFTS